MPELPRQSYSVSLDLTDDEARDLHASITVAVELLRQVVPGPGAILTRDRIDPLLVVARRLSHERRHHGAVANPNRPEAQHA